MCVCGSFGRGKVLGCIRSLLLTFSASSCSVTLSFLSHDLYGDRMRGRLSEYKALTLRRDAPAGTGPYPLEVAHVGGLYWSANERQVVDFCCLLVSLV